MQDVCLKIFLGVLFGKKIAEFIERIIIKPSQNNRSLKCYAGKAGTVGKSSCSNTGNAARYGYAGKDSYSLNLVISDDTQSL